ncbi:MAG: CoB--CoM heterodisulfide reductase iron-sulfur subunit A family protein [Chloroflexi bacterium]|nr:CoB--CoM heterodisulfide reductase iron-sulfur subunit A family protein [Chloroflexota bacterium]
MEPKIGVYVCHCGSNIAGIVDVEKVAEFARTLPSVVVARDYKFMCSDPGQDLIKKDIKELGVNRVVVASCSPQMHEPTFRRAVQEGGLNPYYFEMANIREHCSWVTENPKEATEKAKALVSAAVRRIYYHQPLENKQVPVHPDTLIVGGGIAGIQAALEIANSGHKVYLVEKEPSIGGHMMQLDKTFPTLDCSACIRTPKMSLVGAHPQIELLTYSEIDYVSGYVGNFRVKIRKKARSVDASLCSGCGICSTKCPIKIDSEFDEKLTKRKAIYSPFAQAVPNVPVIDKEHCTFFLKGKCRACEKFCERNAINFQQEDEILDIEVGNIILTTGYKLFDPSPIKEYGYGRLDNVITSLEFERMVNSAGPTTGKVLLKNGEEPKSIAIVHCVGSRDEKYHEYCSRVCCMYGMKFAHLLKEHIHGSKVYEFYIDIRSFGKGYEEFYNRVQKEGTVFFRGRPGEVTDVAQTPEEKGKLIVQFEDTLVGKQSRLPVDMVVLCSGIEPQADAQETAHKFNISCGKENFFTEKHPKLDPVATMTDGVFIAGCCQGPKDIPDTVAQASAAAARVLALINKGKVEIEADTAFIDEAKCSGCRVCNLLCPYSAISYIEKDKVSRVNEALCKGCGTCVAGCPSGAIIHKHFTNEQINAEIEGILV